MDHTDALFAARLARMSRLLELRRARCEAGAALLVGRLVAQEGGDTEEETRTHARAPMYPASAGQRSEQ